MTQRTEVAPPTPACDWPVITRGTYFEDHVVGREFEHHWGRTIHSSENATFTTSMLAFDSRYLDASYARQEGHDSELAHPMLAFTTVLGLSVEDLSETGGAFLGATDLRFLEHIHTGDTLYAASRVIDVRPSRSRPEFGIVTWRTSGQNQFGDTVIEFERTNLVPRRKPSSTCFPPPTGYANSFFVGQRFRHPRTRTITDFDLANFTLSVMNTAQGHFSEHSMKDHEFKSRINFGGLTLSLVVGLATQDVAAQAIREIGLDDVSFTNPVRVGDTIGAATEVVAIDFDGPQDESIVTFRHIGFNQHGSVVCEASRLVAVQAADPAIPTVNFNTPEEEE